MINQPRLLSAGWFGSCKRGNTFAWPWRALLQVYDLASSTSFHHRSNASDTSICGGWPDGGNEITTAAILLATCVIHLHNTAEESQTTPYRLARRWKSWKIIWGNRGEVRSLRIWRIHLAHVLAATCHPPGTPLFRRTTFFSGSLQAADRGKA